ncbi:hypothetical protein [Salicibibacter halophilus]|uniref:hypothetical protein n=1 Tax=Salicibibacter halophilus TaxID=2502791 RepID=UPI00135B2C48|nr:hypothetical protein [Salicibibacter halophilus]
MLKRLRPYVEVTIVTLILTGVLLLIDAPTSVLVAIPYIYIIVMIVQWFKEQHKAPE